MVNVSRSCTRLKNVYITLQKEVQGFLTTEVSHGRKTWNTFYSPACWRQVDDNKFNIEGGDEFEMQLSIGN